MKHKKASIRFRKQLKDQLPVLQSENLISTEQAHAISQRYLLNNLAAESTSKLLVFIYSLGVFLVGIGIISFVAYHWNGMSRGVRLAVILTAMLSCHGVGFYLWKIADKNPKVGHALICLGTLIFGANIGLIAQIFHIKGNWNSGFLPWAIGAIIMAYVVGSVPNAAIAVITSFIWFLGQFGWGGHSQVCWYPLGAAFLFGGFAYYKRSALIFVMTLLSLAISLPVCISSGGGETFGVISAMLTVGLLYFSLGLFFRNSIDYKSFTCPAIILGISSTVVALFLNSFMEFADEMKHNIFIFVGNLESGLINLAVVSAVALIMIPFAIRQIRDSLALKIIMVPMVAAPIFIIGFTFVNDIAVAITANVLFLVLGVVLICSARLLEDRRLFWGGVLIIAAFAVSRAIEYETGLLIKSAVFIFCGIALMVAGVMFEKFLKSRRTSIE